MSNQQQPRQRFRFGSFFQAAQRPQPRPNPPTTTPSQQPAIRPRLPAPQPTPSQQPAIRPRPPAPQPTPSQQPAIRPPPAPQPTPSQEPPRPVGASKEVTVQRFPVKPTLVAAPAPSLPGPPVQAPIPPLAFQLAPPVETPPVPPPRPLRASNQATMNRSVTSPMPSSVPPQRFPLPPTSMPRTPSKSSNQDHSIIKSPEYVKQTSYSPSGTRLILAGVNRGAVMDLNNTDKKDHSSFRGNGKKLGSVIDDGKEETSNPNMDSKTHKKGMDSQSSTMKAFINNNVQGINNSIVLNSSCKENDPGVHLCLSRKGNVGRDEILKKGQI